MSGFGGFNSGSTGSGLFGDKPPEQGSSGFTIPTTTGSTVTSGLGFGSATFGTGSSNLFGAQQQTSPFGTGFGGKSPSTGAGFTFNPSTANAPTFGSTATNTTAPSFGVTTTTSASVFSISTTSTSIPTLGTFGTTNTSTLSSTPLTFHNSKTPGIIGLSSNYTFPVTSTTAPAFNFGSAATAAPSTSLTFGVQTTSTVTSVTTVASISVAPTTTTAPTLTFGVSTTGTTSASVQSTGFSLSQPITTTSLTFGGTKTTKSVTFGTVTSGFNSVITTAAATFTLGTATTTTSLGINLFGTPRATETVAGITPVSAGLGGIDNKQTTQGLSGPGTVEPKQAKDHPLPDPILQTLNEFQNFTKQQKSLSVEISHGSSKPLKKVQEDTEAMESLLTMITSGLTRNAIAVDKLKSETAQGLHQAELAQRNHETPPGLDYDNSAPADYFNDLVSKFETDTVRLRVQIEASEKHLRSLTQSSTISPQELTLAMRQLHETLIVLAARVQALHTSVQSQKEQYKNLRRVYFKDDTNIFENDLDQNLVKKQTVYSLRSLTGPTPFSENPGTRPPLNVDGLAVLASSTVASVPASSANTSDEIETEKPNCISDSKALDITSSNDGGVLKEIIKEGEGDAFPVVGCTVTVYYHGTLLDGTVFDSTEPEKPFIFTLGKESVIEAWELGIATMKKGEVAVFTCKPEYAYGENGRPPKIPPNATLIFKITLVDWLPEDISKEKDKGILRSIIRKGSGYSSPNNGALVEVHLTGKYNGKVFEDRDVLFNLGEGSEFGVIEGVEQALYLFKKKEKSDLEIKPKYAFQEEGHKEFGIPPNAVIHYTVELLNFEKAKESWDMDASEKISQAKLLKEKATNYFKSGKYNLAVKLYNNAVEFISSDAGFSGEGENEEREALLLAIRLNLGLTYLKLNQNYEAKKECDEALKMDPDNVKGLFRRGQAYLNLNEPEKAKVDFEAVVRLESMNKLAANQILICLNKIKQQREKEKKIYANMFEKFAQKDKEKEESVQKEPDTMKLGEWGKEERDREPTEFEQENPDILMLNKTGEFKNM